MLLIVQFLVANYRPEISLMGIKLAVESVTLLIVIIVLIFALRRCKRNNNNSSSQIQNRGSDARDELPNHNSTPISSNADVDFVSVSLII